MRRFINALRRAFLALVAAGSTNALAWGAEGHRLVAELAQMRLMPGAAAEVHRLLGLEPGATMASVSTWADRVRGDGSGALHYVSLPEGECTYSPQRDCPDGRCIVEAITGQLAILRSTASDADRLTALKWVIHLVGDIHQPLHVGLASDKGGNLFQVQAFGRGSNLHAVWDGGLIRRRAGGLGQLLRDASAAGPGGPPAADPALWAHQSCAIRSGTAFYPEDRAVGAAYAEHWDGALVAQLALAGRRLAEVLNGALLPPAAPLQRENRHGR